MSRYIDADKLNGYEFGLISPKAQDLFHKIINNAPTEDVKSIVRGEWICANESCAICNKCNRLNQMYGDFCKYCGADMRKE